MKQLRSKAQTLTQGERHLLLTGCPYPEKGSWKDYNEPWVRPFTLASPAGRSELKALWLLHREEIMETWKGKGQPWAAKQFDTKKP